MNYNIIEIKSFNFAIKIIAVYKHLCHEKKEFVLSKQLLKCGTSIGANVKEGLRGQSKKDFLAKMNIALKESNETEYWLELLIASGFMVEKELLNECQEICRILNSIVATTKRNLEI